MKGIEPSYAAWEAAVLPLNYTRVFLCVDTASRVGWTVKSLVPAQMDFREVPEGRHCGTPGSYCQETMSSDFVVPDLNNLSPFLPGRLSLPMLKAPISARGALGAVKSVYWLETSS